MKCFLIPSLPCLSLDVCFTALTAPWLTEAGYEHALKYLREPPSFAEEPGEQFAQD